MRYAAFLRGINVSGQKIIKMTALKEMFEALKFKNVVTYIQSGNVAFDTKESEDTKLRDKIEKHLAKSLGYDVTVMVRTIPEIEQVIANTPYGNPGDGKKLYVSFLSAVPEKELLQTLETFNNDNEEFTPSAREIYIACKSYGDTKFSNTFLEKKLKVAATTRNWATVNKMTTL